MQSGTYSLIDRDKVVKDCLCVLLLSSPLGIQLGIGIKCILLVPREDKGWSNRAEYQRTLQTRERSAFVRWPKVWSTAYFETSPHERCIVILLIHQRPTHPTITTTTASILYLVLFLGSLIIVTYFIKAPSSSPSTTMFPLSNLARFPCLVLGYLRIVFCVVHNLYCIPTYLLLTWMASPIFCISPTTYSKIENTLYYWLLYVVSGWSYGAGLVVHEHGDDIYSLPSGKLMLCIMPWPNAKHSYPLCRWER